ncbi:hypothetical protein Ddc_22187 [Ditylenchus destructor]|nr:hypothetical protein Ddc_22187 [Ditylenchus destructor]
MFWCNLLQKLLAEKLLAPNLWLMWNSFLRHQAKLEQKKRDGLKEECDKNPDLSIMRYREQSLIRFNRLTPKAFQCEFESFISTKDLYNTSKGFLGADGYLEFELRVTLEEINGKIIRPVVQELEDKTETSELEIVLANQKINGHAKQIVLLERKSSAVNQKIIKNENIIATLERDIGGHEHKFGELEANSSNLLATLHQAIVRISELEIKNQNMESRIVELSTNQSQKNSSLEEKNNSLQTQINSLIAQINLLLDQSRNAHDFRQSMFSGCMSLCMNYISLKAIGCACMLVPLAIALSSVDFGSKWTWFILFSIIAIGIYAYILYQKAKESHAAWLTQLNSLLAQLQDWWNSATTACQSYFEKKDAKVDAILDNITEMQCTSKLILAAIPATQETLKQTIEEAGKFSRTLNEYTRKVGDETTEFISVSKQEMIESSKNFNRFLVQLKNTARIAGSTIETAEENLNWQVGDFFERICGSTQEFSNALALNTNTSRDVMLRAVEGVSSELQTGIRILSRATGRAMENGEFRPTVFAQALVNANVDTRAQFDLVSIFHIFLSKITAFDT